MTRIWKSGTAVLKQLAEDQRNIEKRQRMGRGRWGGEGIKKPNNKIFEIIIWNF